jgi:hypothetical protein
MLQFLIQNLMHIWSLRCTVSKLTSDDERMTRRLYVHVMYYMHEVSVAVAQLQFYSKEKAQI